MTSTQDIVAKLWSLCHVLRDDGVSYQEYVTELTFLLFLKMMQETEREGRIPADYRWLTIARREGMDQLDHYRRALLDLGKAPDMTVQAIFTDAQTKLRKPANLKTLTRPSTSWTGSRRARRALATSTRACWRRTPGRRNPARANISRPAR